MAWSSAGPWNENDSVISPSSPLASTCASRWPSRQTLPSLPKRTMSPGASFFAGFTSACQREPSSRLISVASIFGSVSRPMRRPLSCAEITLVSLTTSWSPGCSQCGRSATLRSCNTPPRWTTSMRAESRGLAGRSAMLVAGRSKSKRSVRMAPVRLTHLASFRGTRSVNPQSRDSGFDAFASPENDGKRLRRVGGHVRLDDLVGVLHRLAALDLVDVLHAGGDLAPDRVLAVEEGGVVEADEELAVAGIRARGAGHRGGAAHVRFLVEFGLQLLARAAGAGALRATGLRHETLDDAVEHDAVVKSLAHQFLDPGDMARRQIGAHLDGDGSLGGFKNQSIFCISHARFSSGLGGRLRDLKVTAKGRPAIAPLSPSVNGNGAQRCNVSMTAIRYASRSLSPAFADS